MFKIVKELIEINNNLKELNKSIKEKNKEFDDITCKINSQFVTVTGLENSIERNIYTKEQTLETINKECDYRDNYNKCKKENTDLLEFIEKYCKYANKYEVIEIFNELNKIYEIKRI